jgi:hypothetical protein
MGGPQCPTISPGPLAGFRSSSGLFKDHQIASLALHNFDLVVSAGRRLEGTVATKGKPLLQVQQRLIYVSTQGCRRGKIGTGVAGARASNSNGGRYDP